MGGANLGLKIRYTGPKSSLTASLEPMGLLLAPESTEKLFAGIKNELLQELNVYFKSHRKRNLEMHEEPWRLTRQNNLFHVIKVNSSITLNKDIVRLNIGKVSALEENAPYWKLINYGGKINVPTMNFKNGRKVKGYFGHFGQRGAPGTATKETFKFGSAPLFLMQPKRPITGMHYLEFMSMQFEKILTKKLKEYDEKIDEFKRRSEAREDRQMFLLRLGHYQKAKDYLLDMKIDLNKAPLILMKNMLASQGYTMNEGFTMADYSVIFNRTRRG